MYKSRRVPFSLFVNIPLTTPRINFRISECHHRFSIDLIVIFSAKNGKLFLDHTDPLSYITSCLKQHSALRMNLLNDRLDVNLRRAHNLTDNGDVD